MIWFYDSKLQWWSVALKYSIGYCSKVVIFDTMKDWIEIFAFFEVFKKIFVDLLIMCPSILKNFEKAGVGWRILGKTLFGKVRRPIFW